jgi:DNA (cytosine-5)-methyltransferase 1
MNHIELFAGCGGLSLGLEAAGFTRLLANELSPMAAETFAYNFLHENLQQKAHQQTPAEKTHWLSSNYPRNDLANRLREDPRTFPPLSEAAYSDMTPSNIKKGDLIVGNLVELNHYLAQHPAFLAQLNSGFGEGACDVVSGGPPCQSFSLAGLRQLDNDRNTLPWEFAKFVQHVKPKFAVLENVSGILRAFKQGTQKYYAWFEVAQAFAKVGYIPLCLHVNAKLAGVAQNRPRFIMIAVRADILAQLKPHLNDTECALFNGAETLYQRVNNNQSCGLDDLRYFEAEKPHDNAFFSNTFLHHLVAYKHAQHTVEHAIDDLRRRGKKSDYQQLIAQTFQSHTAPKAIANHALRANGTHVTKRFRVYQVMQKTTADTTKEVQNILRGHTAQLSDPAFNELKKYAFSDGTKTTLKFNQRDEMANFLATLTTKKHSQKALDPNQPAPATLSIPDDACHYHHTEVRTLTVRELARIQSFPDTFEFCSKVTTGGKMRRYEVPQYTQVGNAVPPLLGWAIGQSLQELANKIPVVDKTVVAKSQQPISLNTPLGDKIVSQPPTINAA